MDLARYESVIGEIEDASYDEALVARKKQGVKLGRPKGTGKSKLDQYRPDIEAHLKNGATQKWIAHRYHVTEATLSRWVKKHGLKK